MHALTLYVEAVIQQYGYLGMFLLTTSEQFIFPIPVDVFFGFSIEQGLLYQNLMVIVLIATLLGSLIGYFLGKFLGHPALVWLVGKTKVDKGEAFIRKWGIWGVILAGLTPIPFKVIPWTAGIFEMPLGRFLIGVIESRMPRYMLIADAGAKFFDGMPVLTQRKAKPSGSRTLPKSRLQRTGRKSQKTTCSFYLFPPALIGQMPKSQPIRRKPSQYRYERFGRSQTRPMDSRQKTLFR